jgi:hypothetical protein
MDLGSNVFEYGQSYVGLSRVRNLEGLYLSNFNPRKIKTNPTVAEFYQTIPEVPNALGGGFSEALSEASEARSSEARSSEARSSEARSSETSNEGETKKVQDFTKYAYVDSSIKIIKL